MRKKLVEDIAEQFQDITLCDHPGCDCSAEHRAPKNRELNEYYIFCQEHARSYNQRWDYYSGMNPEEIEESRYDDYTWNRPTWTFGKDTFDFRKAEEDLRQHQAGFNNHKEQQTEAAASPYIRDIQKALKVLGIKQKPKTFQKVQDKYKQLAKKYHPDANQGDLSKEERLKEINQAYTLLRGFRDMFG